MVLQSISHVVLQVMCELQIMHDIFLLLLELFAGLIIIELLLLLELVPRLRVFTTSSNYLALLLKWCCCMG
jgi:hypothetical protein